MIKQDFNKTKIIGFVGKTCSGKSTISNHLSNFLNKKNIKTKIIEVDKIGKKLYEKEYKNGQIIEKIKNSFSNYDILDNNEISRSKLANIVFNDKKMLNKLNLICFKEIIEILEKEIFLYSKQNEVIILDCAILFESNIYKICDLIIFVEVDFEIQLNRVINRFKVTKDEANIRISGQNFDKFKNLSHITIKNNDLSILEREEISKMIFHKLFNQIN
jgi:dephospho-CoA kinase